jgi:hypothetical protein
MWIQLSYQDNLRVFIMLTMTAVLTVLPSTEATPMGELATPVDLSKSVSQPLLTDETIAVDPRCSTCTTGCPPTCRPPTIHPPSSCHNCDHQCPPHMPKTNKFPNLPSFTYGTNCDFCDHELYTLTCIETVFDCSSRCAVDRKCSHFTYIAGLKGGTCMLKEAPGSGGSWASAIPSPSPYMCGYIPRRALVDFFLNICLGKDITGGRRWNKRVFHQVYH